MVRALLDGSKTQTRRVCKHQPYGNGFAFEGGDYLCHNDYLPPSAMLMDVYKGGKYLYATSNMEGWEAECPYGAPGDRLWVRESLKAVLDEQENIVDYAYSADDAKVPRCPDLGPEFCDGMAFAHLARPSGLPSIHMPRWASRITLEVTGVRVEQLQDISEADARAEGARECDPVSGREVLLAGASQRGSFVLHYRDIWEQINGTGSWAANPWVWVVEFRRLP